MLIHQILLKTDLANLKSDMCKLEIDKSNNVASNLNNLKSRLEKLDVQKSVTALDNLSKLSDKLITYC